MSSGQKRLVFNSRERALSTDWNRVQAFAAAGLSDLLQFRFNNPRQNSLQFPGVQVPPTAVATPLLADVYGGLLVLPATTSIQVQPGVMGCWAPDPGSSTADDSKYLLIDDPGVTSTTLMTFTSNSGGSVPRIDCIECRPIVTVLESDSRDIFNTTTGLFTPGPVTKVSAGRLEYRLRVGGSGTGLTLAAGWLPLAVAVVSTAATDFSTVDFYDVRPLVEDRVSDSQPAIVSGSDNTEQYCPVRSAEYYGLLNGSSEMIVIGHAESEFGGYKAGGWLRRSSPWFSGGTFAGTGPDDGDYNQLNVSLPENASSSIALGSNKILYLVALFPGGLPRWVRYSHSAVIGGFGRIPRGPRGILVVTDHQPFPNGVVYNIPLTWLPASVAGCVIGTVKCNAAGSAMEPVSARGLITNNSRVFFGVTRTSGTSSIWPLVAGTHYPNDAAELLVSCSLQLTNGGSEESILVQVKLTDASGLPYGDLAYETHTAPAGNSTKYLTFRVPVFAHPDGAFSSNSGPAPSIAITLTSGSTTFTTGSNAQVIQISGWRLQ